LNREGLFVERTQRSGDRDRAYSKPMPPRTQRREEDYDHELRRRIRNYELNSEGLFVARSQRGSGRDRAYSKPTPSRTRRNETRRITTTNYDDELRSTK